MITLRRNETDRLLELGGGAVPIVRPECMGGRDVNMDTRSCTDQNGKQTVDIVWDLEKFPWPISDSEFDGIISHFCIEHISYINVPKFVAEVFRVLKPGGKAVIITANQQAQFEWLLKNPDGWDGKSAFVSCSEILYGSQDYEANAHKSFFSPTIITKLFADSGFENVVTQPYGARNTDLCVEAVKPNVQEPVEEKPAIVAATPIAREVPEQKPVVEQKVEYPPAAEMFTHEYYDGGRGKWGGYREMYRDFPYHETVARHVLARKPERVIEFGCGRGYILKRLEDAGVGVFGVDASQHCYMTRVCDSVYQGDVAENPMAHLDVNVPYYFAFSLNFWEHIEEDKIDVVVDKMNKYCNRGLHGIGFDDKSFGHDKTIRTLKPKAWWKAKFPSTHEIVDSDELKAGEVAPEVYRGDGKIKLNIGCHMGMHHHGWQNIDAVDLLQFALANRYHYRHMDVRLGLPYKTGEVDLLFCCHMFEHLSYQEGLSFLRECRRVLKTDGAMRIIVPDADKLIRGYMYDSMDQYDCINDACANANTMCAKLWEMLFTGHQAMYDDDTIAEYLAKAGFIASTASFRTTDVPAVKQILRETNDLLPCHSLYMDAVPST